MTKADIVSKISDKSGIEKADAVNLMINGSINEQLPASILQSHPDVTVIVDQLAGSKL